MLRHYDEIGLLVPEETDPWTGYRRYAAAQLMTANRITALRGLGFSLAETAALLACWEDRTAMETRLLAQRAGRPPFRRHWTGCGFWTQPSNG